MDTSDNDRPDTGVPPLVLDILEAADLLRCGRSTIYELLKAGEIVAIKIGRRRLVTYGSVVRYVERLEAEATRELGGES